MGSHKRCFSPPFLGSNPCTAIVKKHAFKTLQVNVRKSKGDPMKVALIQNVTLNDHRSVHSHNVACELQKRGIDVDLILQKTDEDLFFHDQPYRLIQLPGETYSVQGQITFMKASYNQIQEERYDIIHGKNPFSSVCAPLFLKRLGLIKSRIIYDMRGLWVDFGVHAGQFSPVLGTVLHAVDKTLMHLCDHVIAISSELEQVLISKGIPPRKVTTIPGSGVNIDEVEHILSEPLEDLGISSPVTGYVGTVSASRQSDRLIEAFHHLLNHCKECHLVLVGPEDGTVSHLLSGENIHYLGVVPHRKALSLLKSFDVAVAYHDIDEPLFNVAVPIKILEYMAAGIPIVATTHAMYKNILVHRKTGYLTRSNPESFAQGILSVLKDELLQKSMVTQARMEVEKYSIQSLVDQLESLYYNLID